MKTKIVKPTKIIRPFDNVEVRLFGCNSGKTDWSIKTLEKPEDYQNDIYRQINLVAYDAGVRWLLAPRPSEFNALICTGEDLNVTVRAPVMRNAEGTVEQRYVKIMRGCNADGVEIPRDGVIRQGFWLSSADCPTLIVTDGRRIICAHCGYKSLVDLQALVGKPTRPYFSVVDAVIAEFTKISVPPKKLKAFVTLGIGPHFVVMRSVRQEIDHEGDRILVYEKEKFATHEANWKKARFFKTTPSYDIATDIRKLTECQCLNRGIGNVRIDDNDTFADKDKDGKSLWWSYERAMKQSPADKLKRNGVMVIHR